MISLSIGVLGSRWWYCNEHYHRANGPAVIISAALENWYQKIWYLNGKRHRTDGPAIMRCDGYRSWYINDQMLSDYEIMFLVTQGQNND